MTCEVCGEPSSARYCSTRCQRRSDITGLRVCVWCKTVLVRKRFPTRWETQARFAARRYCEHACVRKARAWSDAKAGVAKASTVQGRILALLTQYAGLPLSYADVSEELGLSPDSLRTAATNLVRDGLVERYRFEGQTLLRALEWEKAA